MKSVQIIFSVFVGIILLNGVQSELETKVSFFTRQSLTNTTDKQGWEVFLNSASYDLVSDCGNAVMFGGKFRFGNVNTDGQQTFIRKIFKNLPEHTGVKVAGFYHLIDQFSDDTIFYGFLDNQYLVYMPIKNHTQIDYSKSLCNDQRYADDINIPFEKYFDHTKNELTLQFQTNQKGLSQGFWGLSDISIELTGIPAPTTPPTTTNTAKYTGSVVQDGKCVPTCQEGYVVLNGVCKQQCPDNLVNDNGFCKERCTIVAGQVARQINGKWICANSCSDLEVLSEGKCLSSCPAGQVNDHGVCSNKCTKPVDVLDGTTCRASCSNNQQVNNQGVCADSCSNGLVNNKGVCSTSCDAGLFNDTFKCKPECTGTNAFYNGQVCVSSCPAPLLTEGFKCVTQCTAPKVQDGNVCKDACGNTYQELFTKKSKKNTLKKTNKKNKKIRLHKKNAQWIN